MSIASDPAIADQGPAAAQATSGSTVRRHRASARAAYGEVVLGHYLKRIDPAVAKSFTDEQREAIKTMLGVRGAAKHMVELRRSVPLGRKRWYLVFLFGAERRSLHRLERDGAVSRPFNLLIYVLLGTVAFALAIGAIAALKL